MNEDIYDFIAIGIGPFNLSLAGLTAPLRGVRAVFLDKRSGFDWHPGMLIDACSLMMHLPSFFMNCPTCTNEHT